MFAVHSFKNEALTWKAPQKYFADFQYTLDNERFHRRLEYSPPRNSDQNIPFSSHALFFPSNTIDSVCVP